MASIADLSDGQFRSAKFQLLFRSAEEKYGLAGCFHVDFGAKTLTISSFSSLKWALI